jgi:hypothetical protein
MARPQIHKDVLALTQVQFEGVNRGRESMSIHERPPLSMAVAVAVAVENPGV